METDADWLSMSEKRELERLGWPVDGAFEPEPVEMPCEPEAVTPPYDPTPFDNLPRDLIFPVEPALDYLLVDLG